MNSRLILLLSTMMLLTACDILTDKKSLSESISDDSVKKLASPVKDEVIMKTRSIIKTKQNQIQIPKKFYQKVSLTINESLPLKSVLYEIAKQLKINIQIDPSIESKVIFMAENKPFIEVIDAVCDIANLRYTIQNDFLKIEKDLPYSQNYDVQFLNLSRDSENKIAIATEVTGSKGNNIVNNNDSSVSNSDSTVTFKAKSEFWNDLSNGIQIILSANNQNKYSVNKQSGIITVYANSKYQKDIQSYIEQIREANNSQVLIEAKIIEVVLNNEYKRGINWNIVLQNSNITTNFANNGNNMPSFSYKISDTDNILKALEQFGSVRTISNPRITAMNNQAAVIKIAENQVYFKLNYDKVYSNKESLREDVNISSDIKTIPIGLVMFVQPSIDIKNGIVSLFLRPTITKLQNTVNDPAVDIAIQSANNQSRNISKDKYPESKIPITEVREVASVLKLHDGEVAVLGGFMEVISAKSKSGLPLIKDIPLFGELSSEYDTKDKVVELVILVKVKISEPTTLQRAADIRLQRFVPDPRPF
ncbi:MAG: hypothetical protein IJ848_01155 [Alphaproteobacteria bacterium]|nr:hypothetical protein [Alphaproteobacteria bacterium]